MLTDNVSILSADTGAWVILTLCPHQRVAYLSQTGGAIRKVPETLDTGASWSKYVPEGSLNVTPGPDPFLASVSCVAITMFCFVWAP